MSDLIPDFDTAEDEVDFLRGYLERANEELEQKEARITELENALNEAADELEGCAEYSLNCAGEKARAIANNKDKG